MSTYEKKHKEEVVRATKLWECGDITRENLEYIFPELAESEEEKIRKEILEFVTIVADSKSNKMEWLAWLEKQGKQASAIRWYNTSLTPEEMRELLVEWDSEDATWHEVAFYHADTKTFWDGERQVENVTRWCYIDDMLENQAPKPKWSEEDEHHWMMCLECVEECATQEREDFSKTIQWLQELKQRMEEQQ